MALVPAPSPAEITLDERIEVAVEDALNVPHLDLSSQILDHLIGLHDIATDLSAPGGLTLFAPNLIDVGQALDPSQFMEPSLQNRHGPCLVLQLAPFVLNRHDQAAWEVGEANRRVGLVDMLPSGALRPVGVDAQVVGIDLERFGIRQLRDYVDAGKRGLPSDRKSVV